MFLLRCPIKSSYHSGGSILSTAATRSARCICRRQRSHRSPLPALVEAMAVIETPKPELRQNNTHRGIHSESDNSRSPDGGRVGARGRAAQSRGRSVGFPFAASIGFAGQRLPRTFSLVTFLYGHKKVTPIIKSQLYDKLKFTQSSRSLSQVRIFPVSAWIS